MTAKKDARTPLSCQVRSYIGGLPGRIRALAALESRIARDAKNR
ncbi:hypothetical protein SAMN05216421_0824 [Halopseudomonas xinjiangensis]|uniref:Uncharacterized protein n=1 Tax=Halopseudomonas xinjiangensis TaxID=487184 RepID=A0A1H1P3D4_9GAMM|nr:hypothetical protein SAMN05216421_0824 [Halopseudomonas xinjiangensis]